MSKYKKSYYDYDSDCEYCKSDLGQLQLQLQLQEQRQEQFQAQLQQQLQAQVQAQLQVQAQAQAQAQAQNDTDTSTFENIGNPTVNVNVSSNSGGNSGEDLVRASAFKAIKSVNQNVAANTNVQVLYQNEQFDLANEYNPATSTFTPATDGVYAVIGSIEFNPTNPNLNFRARIEIHVNGTVANALDNDFFGGGTGFTNVVAVSTILQLKAGDTVSVFAQSSIAGSIQVNQGIDVGGTHFEAARFSSPTK